VSPKRISAAQAGQLLQDIKPAGAVEAARCELAAEFLAGLRRIDGQIRDAKDKLTTAVRACATTLTEIFANVQVPEKSTRSSPARSESQRNLS
jgi:hypothetical protein